MQILIVTPEAARWTAFGEGLRAAGLSCSFAGAPDDLKAESLKADRPLLVLWDPKSRRKTPRNPVGSRSFKLKVRETHGLFY